MKARRVSLYPDCVDELIQIIPLSEVSVAAYFIKKKAFDQEFLQCRLNVDFLQRLRATQISAKSYDIIHPSEAQNDTLKIGDVVAVLSNEKITKDFTNFDQVLFFSVITGYDNNEPGYLVAYMGRVGINVRGPIKPKDILFPSTNEMGIATRHRNPNFPYPIAIACEELDGDKTEMISAIIHPLIRIY